jgi:hypothetical protein
MRRLDAEMFLLQSRPSDCHEHHADPEPSVAPSPCGTVRGSSRCTIIGLILFGLPDHRTRGVRRRLLIVHQPFQPFQKALAAPSTDGCWLGRHSTSLDLCVRIGLWITRPPEAFLYMGEFQDSAQVGQSLDVTSSAAWSAT